ncbi:MAG: hypothetical protein AAGA92_00270 [Planctomycetota bacterium]
MTSSVESLVSFTGYFCVFFPVLLVLWRYFRAGDDLVSAWNLALFGCMASLGAGAFEALDPPNSVFELYIPFEFPAAHYVDVVYRTFFFMGCLLLFYYSGQRIKRFAGNRFIETPEWSGSLLTWALFICALSVLGGLFVRVPFFGQILQNLGQKGAVFATTFTFYAWYKKKGSIPALLLFVVVLGVAALYVTQVNRGRRLLLTLAMAPAAVMYWTSWRYKKPGRVLLYGGVAGAAIITVGLAYQQIRRYDQHGGGERSVANTIAALSNINSDAIVDQVSGWKHTLGQNVFQYAMLTRRAVESGALEPRFLNTVQFTLAYPIPRSFWEGKPPLVGIIIIKALRLGHETTWGLSVVGHSYYEGGYLAIAVYAVIIVVLVRLFDEPLRREPENPFFIASLAAGSAFIVSWVRGDLGIHTVDLLECFLFAQLLNYSSRMFSAARPLAYAPQWQQLAPWGYFPRQ